MNISQFNAVFSKVCIVERSMYFPIKPIVPTIEITISLVLTIYRDIAECVSSSIY